MKKAQRHVQDEKNACELRNAAQQTGKCRGYILAESSNLQKRGDVQGHKRKGPWPEMKARPRLASALIAVPKQQCMGVRLATICNGVLLKGFHGEALLLYSRLHVASGCKMSCLKSWLSSAASERLAILSGTDIRPRVPVLCFRLQNP